MTKAKTKKEGPTPLSIQGPLTIYEVVDVRERLLAHIKKTGELSLELEAVTDCDTAGIQLLYSALKTTKDRDRPFNLKNVSIAVKEAAERAGVNLELFCKGQ